VKYVWRIRFKTKRKKKKVMKMMILKKKPEAPEKDSLNQTKELK